MIKTIYDRPVWVKMYNEITDKGVIYIVRVVDSHSYELIDLKTFDNEKDAQNFYNSIDY